MRGPVGALVGPSGSTCLQKPNVRGCTPCARHVAGSPLLPQLTARSRGRGHRQKVPHASANAPGPVTSQAPTVPSAAVSHETRELTAAEVQAKERQREKARRRRSEQQTYQMSAVAASLLVTAIAVVAIHYRFVFAAENGAEFDWFQATCALSMVFGGVVGMEAYARWAHLYLWHDSPLSRKFLWGSFPVLHQSHHEVRVGPFEKNDIFAIMNAVPAMAACMWGFLDTSPTGGFVFCLGLGVTLYGICYMFIHDGLVHRRFPVGPIADVPYLKRVAMAHKLHHSNDLGGVPYGLFLGPQEVEAAGGKAILDRMCERGTPEKVSR